MSKTQGKPQTDQGQAIIDDYCCTVCHASADFVRYEIQPTIKSWIGFCLEHLENARTEDRKNINVKYISIEEYKTSQIIET